MSKKFLENLIKDYKQLLRRKEIVEECIAEQRQKLIKFYVYTGAELTKLQVKKEGKKEALDWDKDPDGRDKFFN